MLWQGVNSGVNCRSSCHTACQRSLLGIDTSFLILWLRFEIGIMDVNNKSINKSLFLTLARLRSSAPRNLKQACWIMG